jgi:SAM-dependent methyltransferase
LERHRLFKIWVDQNSGEISGRRLLHFAPEQIVARLVRPLGSHYIAADIDPNRADLFLNIEAIALEDQTVDVVICFHVLEHVNDALALKEMRRILAPGGLLLMMTPVVEGWPTTYEDPRVKTAQERELHYGQADHVRYFGADIRKKMHDAGFAVSEFTAIEPDVSRSSLLRGEKLFLGRIVD